MRSPTITSATGTSTSPSRPSQCATSGRRACRARMAVGGLAFGACLQPFAQQHQRDHHRRAFKVQVHHGAVGCAQPQPDRQCPAGRGANGHQQIHIAAERQQRMPACFVKACTKNELHWCCQQKLKPGRQHPVLAKQVAKHGQGQRCGQQCAQGHRSEAGPRRHGFQRIHLRGGAHLVARIAHRTAQARRHLVGVNIHNARRFGGKVDCSLLHARHFPQGALDPARTGRAGHAANSYVDTCGGGRGVSGGGRCVGHGG
jgi:hypothetical protein